VKKVFLKDIKEKDRLDNIFLVAKKEMGLSRSGKPYLNIKLMDKTGDIEARVWDKGSCRRLSGRPSNKYI